METVSEACERLLAEIPWRENPYFTSLRDGTMSREDFVETQAQFYFAVLFFSRPMAACAAKIPRATLRMEVVRNVWEEHGEGDAKLAHGATFRQLMERLADLDEDALDRRALWPEVRIFNTTLAGACVLDEYMVGCAVLGTIERMFSEISGWIGRAIVANGWLEENRLVHYKLHEKLDVKHADDFFEVLEPAWGDDAEDRYAIEQGILLGATVFDGLYAGLHRGRTRRWMRAVTTPHTRA
jgi:pyrroloquinoline-quinone synthase